MLRKVVLIRFKAGPSYEMHATRLMTRVLRNLMDPHHVLRLKGITRKGKKCKMPSLGELEVTCIDKIVM
jgi:hypothetical protein